jgi:hypothetical protein
MLSNRVQLRAGRGVPGRPEEIVATPDGRIFTDAVDDMAANGEHFVPVDFTGSDVRFGPNLYVL